MKTRAQKGLKLLLIRRRILRSSKCRGYFGDPDTVKKGPYNASEWTATIVCSYDKRDQLQKHLKCNLKEITMMRLENNMSGSNLDEDHFTRFGSSLRFGERSKKLELERNQRFWWFLCYFSCQSVSTTGRERRQGFKRERERVVGDLRFAIVFYLQCGLESVVGW